MPLGDNWPIHHGSMLTVLHVRSQSGDNVSDALKTTTRVQRVANQISVSNAVPYMDNVILPAY